jgi:acetyltransferase
MAAPMAVAAAPSDLPARYPAHLREYRRLADGMEVILRPIHPGDEALERTFIAGLSSDSRYNRLLSARDLSAEEIRQLTRIDYDREMAFVAVAGFGAQDRLLGVARYVKDANGNGAEFALVVTDAWQREGIGTLLLDTLTEHARAAGIGRLHAITLAGNRGMQDLARKFGFTRAMDPLDATVRLLEKVLVPASSPATGVVGAAYRGVAANDDVSAAGGGT